MIEKSPGEILARGADGEEHHLEVTELPGGLITLRDDENTRVLAPGAALELCMQLLCCVNCGDQAAPDRTGASERPAPKAFSEGAGLAVHMARFSTTATD